MILQDVPQGAFLCTKNGLICSDDTGNTRGKTNGAEYLMELDYIGNCVELNTMEPVALIIDLYVDTYWDTILCPPL